ncbi:MAG: SMI1/KNR4 family protein, partial [Thermoanaerobaculia bacterium]
MNATEFEGLVDSVRSRHPRWFALETDPPASNEEVEDAEKAIDVRFPEEYRHFLTRYGGGFFAFSNVFSAKQGSEWNVLQRNRDIAMLRDRNGYLVFA